MTLCQFPPQPPEFTAEPDDAGTLPGLSSPSYSNDSAGLPHPAGRFRFWYPQGFESSKSSRPRSFQARAKYPVAMRGSPEEAIYGPLAAREPLVN
jgi:hypothetical protein